MEKKKFNYVLNNYNKPISDTKLLKFLNLTTGVTYAEATTLLQKDTDGLELLKKSLRADILQSYPGFFCEDSVEILPAKQRRQKGLHVSSQFGTFYLDYFLDRFCFKQNRLAQKKVGNRDIKLLEVSLLAPKLLPKNFYSDMFTDKFKALLGSPDEFNKKTSEEKYKINLQLKDYFMLENHLKKVSDPHRVTPHILKLYPEALKYFCRGYKELLGQKSLTPIRGQSKLLAQCLEKGMGFLLESFLVYLKKDMGAFLHTTKEKLIKEAISLLSPELLYGQILNTIIKQATQNVSKLTSMELRVKKVSISLALCNLVIGFIFDCFISEMLPKLSRAVIYADITAELLNNFKTAHSIQNE